ncbi:hypothetical protein [Deinococcus cellulosilyticus]|uniref:Butirosin biosynthesis protein H N-terminal domain-containing protein n=1 Tax=Deinococcus cellulosilyticus (strain DSM 18568 / NBRC 106333 / KACC 11606 / 5516J-15) TaxID=1223518 RepID=A0A511N1D9_DEIC1|nr:hypothetical protein [Deinococcus cellulosilyticus]GEM46146.1 hypothetical protein DC3_17810 [Deinococcus cellulosilyticus NBRC 106333 = KACC 11606]
MSTAENLIHNGTNAPVPEQWILPISTQAPIKGFHFYAFPMAILWDHPETHDWLFSNFLHLAFRKNYGSVPVPFAFYFDDYASSPHLTTSKLSREVLRLTRIDGVQFVQNALLQGHHVYLNLNEYFVPHKAAHQVRNNSHDSLVYGYQDGHFLLLGYDKTGRFRSTEIAFADFAQAYDTLDQMPNPCEQVILYKYNPHGTYELDLHFLVDTLEDYLDSVNISHKFTMLHNAWDRSYGFGSHATLLEFIEKCLRGETYWDYRMVHTLYEHKNFMHLRLVHLHKKLGFAEFATAAEPYQEMTRWAEMVRYIFLHWTKTEDRSNVHKMAELINKIADLEWKVLHQLLQALRVRSLKPVEVM